MLRSDKILKNMCDNGRTQVEKISSQYLGQQLLIVKSQFCSPKVRLLKKKIFGNLLSSPQVCLLRTLVYVNIDIEMCDIVSHIIFLHQTLIIVSPWEKKNAYWHGNTKTITKALPLYQDKLNRIVILLNGHRCCWVLNSFLTQPFFLEVLRNFMGNDTSWKTQRVLLLMSVESTLLTCSSSCKTHASSNSWATKTKG